MEIDVLIVGAGPAGIFASFQAGMLGMSCAVIDSLPYAGGQCTELYPDKPIYDVAGAPKILAKDLISNLLEQAAPFSNPYYFTNQVVSFKKTDSDKFEIQTNSKKTFLAKAIIIASGNGAFTPNKPSIKNLEEYEFSSIFYSVKDPEIFRDKKVAIAGGGDSAIDWAINLAGIAKSVYLVHRRNKFRCAPASLDKIFSLRDKGIVEFLVPYQISAVTGQKGVLHKMLLQNFITAETRELDADYFLAFFGLKMDLGPIRDWGCEIENNKIKVDSSFYQTSIEGIYAIGDICCYEGKLKLIVTGFAEAASALHHAYSRVFHGKQLHFEYSTNKGLPNK